MLLNSVASSGLQKEKSTLYSQLLRTELMDQTDNETKLQDSGQEKSLKLLLSYLFDNEGNPLISFCSRSSKRVARSLNDQKTFEN